MRRLRINFLFFVTFVVIGRAFYTNFIDHSTLAINGDIDVVGGDFIMGDEFEVG